MKDMKKDDFLEEKIASYAEGTDPHVDLSAAKRALAEQQARRRSTVRRTWIALASVCASFLLIAVLLVAVLPAFGGSDRAPDNSGNAPSGAEGDAGGASGAEEPQAVRYELAAAEARAAGVNELVSAYGNSLEKLTDLALLGFGADYTLYSYAGKAVLLETDVLYLQNGRRVSATVYTDLSDGEYAAAELKEYSALPLGGGQYRYKNTYLNGEYLTLGSFTLSGAACCISLQSSYSEAFFSFMEYLL